MPHIIRLTTLEDVRSAKPKTIWYSVRTCWWTHRETDLRTHPKGNGLPCDPRGGMLMMGDAERFLSDAETNPSHYGKHGLAAFMAAHNDNCVVSSSDGRSTCLESWQEYNDILDMTKGMIEHLRRSPTSPWLCEEYEGYLSVDRYRGQRCARCRYLAEVNGVTAEWETLQPRTGFEFHHQFHSMFTHDLFSKSTHWVGHVLSCNLRGRPMPDESTMSESQKVGWGLKSPD